MKLSKKQKKYLIGIGIIILIGIIIAYGNIKSPNSVTFSTTGECRVEGEQCGPNYADDCCGSMICLSGQCVLKKFCMLENALCIEPMFDAGSPDENYCKLGGYVDCGSEGCLLVSGDNHDKCNGDIVPHECTNDEMRCCYDAQDCKTGDYRDSGDVFKCIDEKWTFQKTCGSLDCIEYGVKVADCKDMIYYCTDGILPCSLSNTKDNFCYDTLDECKNHIGICCKSVSGIYTWRMGSCNSNEIPFNGDSYNNEESCTGQNYGNVTSLKVFDLFSKNFVEVLGSSCIENKNCQYVKDYDVTCEQTLSKKILKDAFTEDCQSVIKSVTFKIPVLSSVIAKVVCTVPSEAFSFFINLVPSYGICTAKSTGIMSYVEDLAIYLYNLGVPRTWVIPLMIIIGVIVGIILLVVLIPILTSMAIIKSLKRRIK